MSQVFYKYRSLRSDFSYKFLIDLLLHKRIYAARFDELNDPMEGVFKYPVDAISKDFLKKLNDAKSAERICSFSKSKSLPLMWSHYADGCRGYVVGVKVLDSHLHCHGDVTYGSDVSRLELTWIRDTKERIRDILMRKLDHWEKEEEYRFLVSQGGYLNVEVEELILGWNMSDEDKLFLEKSFLEVDLPKNKIVLLNEYEFN